MCRLSLLSIGLLFALVSCRPAISAPSPTPARPNTPTPSPTTATQPAKPIGLIAHRGAAGLAAENTLTAFRIGIAFNSDFIEMDVHLTKDGVPIIMHDPTIDRTTDGKGRITDLTLADLGRFSTHSTSQSYREPIPTLAQVLDLAKSKSIQVEVAIMVDADGKRYPGIEQKVLDALVAGGMLDRARILAFEFDTLKQVRAIRPHARTIALMSADNFRAPAGMNPLDPAAIIAGVSPFSDGISVSKDSLSVKLVEAAHDRGLLVGVWTVDSEADMQKFIGMGVDSITTDRPDVLKKTLGR